jgi:hypothetical protein
MVRSVTRQSLVLLVTVATSMGAGYALAQESHMDAALHLLRDARHEVEQVVVAGSHRDRALASIDRAISEIRDGMDRDRP